MEVYVTILFLVNFIRTVFVIVVVYYLIRFFTKYILPIFITQSGSGQNFRDARRSKPEGEVTIEGGRYRNSRIPKDEGEYVDFEEVD